MIEMGPGGTTLSTTQTADTFYRLYGDTDGVAAGIARVNTSDSGPFGLTFLKATGTAGYLA